MIVFVNGVSGGVGITIIFLVANHATQGVWMALIVKGNFDELADFIGDATTDRDDWVGIFAILIIGEAGFSDMEIGIFVSEIIIRGSFVGDGFVIHEGLELTGAGREVNSS